MLISCSQTPEPPMAKIAADTLHIHNETLIDDFAWLKDKNRTDPEVLEYLHAENEYTENLMNNTKNLQNKLFQEFKERIPENDVSVPFQKGRYFYYQRREEKKQYTIYCRKKNSLEAEEEIYLDVNKLAASKDFLSVIEIKVSPDHRYLAFAVDTTGAEKYTLQIKDLFQNQMLSENIAEVGDIAWANDSHTLFYSKQDEAGRTYQIYRHRLGNDEKEDDLIFTEKDDRFWLWISRSRDENYLLLGSDSKMTTERWLLNADHPSGKFQLIEPRQQGHQYFVYPHQNELFILTNYQAKNNRIMQTKIAKPRKKFWQEVIPHRDSVYIDLVLFSEYLVIKERSNGSEKLRIFQISNKNSYYINFPDPIYTFYVWKINYKSEILRYSYESLTSPLSVFEVNMKTKAKKLLKEQEVKKDFNKDNYCSERFFAESDEGTEIPISIVYHKDLYDGTNPMLLTGYGAYGDNFDPYFSSSRLSLLDRGISYAIAHVRGGKEMGEEWYEQGKMLNKKNTFTDFIACSQFLLENKIAGKLIIEGGSAGGLLVGAVCNMRPDLFYAAIADVPFVDVLNTMLDPTLSAVVSEYEEWGNPQDFEQYKYILSYAPYENVSAQDYPHILALAGFYDTRVNYWEPAKWVAKLRKTKTDDNLLLLLTDFSAGHSGASGRYDYLKEIAFTYSFILKVLKE